jgi:hypothetical protein
MAEPSSFQTAVAIASGILTILACLLLIAVAVVGAMVWPALRRARGRLVAVERDVTPLLASMTRVATNLEVVTASVRSDVEAIHVTVSEANDRARAAVRGAEDRLQRLDSVVGAAQDEIEAALIDVVAAARGVRAGATVLRGILGLAESGGGPPPETRPGRPRAGAEASPRGPRAQTFETGDPEDAAERTGEEGNGRTRPRTRSRQGRT